MEPIRAPRGDDIEHIEHGPWEINEWIEGKLPRTRIKVVNAGGMKADVLYLHARLRHPELKYEIKVARLRDEHDASHRLVPLVLDHWHEAEPAEPAEPAI